MHFDVVLSSASEREAKLHLSIQYSPVERAEEEREFITKVLFNTFYKGERGIVPLGCCDDVYIEKLKVTTVNPMTVLVWIGVYTMQFIFSI